MAVVAAEPAAGDPTVSASPLAETVVTPSTCVTSATDRTRALDAAFASEAAFRSFYDRALPRVFGYLVSRCGDATVAEDLTQLTFAAAIRERGSYDGLADPITWLIAIARHKLVDRYRSAAREERRFMRLAVREIDAVGADPWAAVDEREQLVAALARLASAQRAVLVLHYADGLPVREIARQLHRSEGAIESLMTRGRAALRAAYGEADDD